MHLLVGMGLDTSGSKEKGDGLRRHVIHRGYLLIGFASRMGLGGWGRMVETFDVDGRAKSVAGFAVGRLIFLLCIGTRNFYESISKHRWKYRNSPTRFVGVFAGPLIVDSEETIGWASICACNTGGGATAESVTKTALGGGCSIISDLNRNPSDIIAVDEENSSGCCILPTKTEMNATSPPTIW